MCRTTVVLSLIALAGCGRPAVAIEYRGGSAFSDSERGIIAIVANRAAIDARKLLPGLPANLRITVQAGSGVIAETGENGTTGLPAAVYWTVDPNHEGGVMGVVKKQMRATLFHEWYHLLRETTFAPATIAERAVNEGLATAFERDFGGAPTPWGDYPPEIAGWTRELLSLPDDAPSRQWMFEHPDGRRWIGYKVGTYLADRAKAASGLSLADLATVPTEKIIAMAHVN